jgi:hypothetical protein
MSNDNKKPRIKQGKSAAQQYKEALEEARRNLAQELETLQQKKDQLGYKNSSWETVLAIVLDENSDTITQSELITLQNRYRTLLKQKRRLRTPQEIVAEFNKTYAIIRIDQTYVLHEHVNAFGLPDFSLESRASFKSFHEDDRVLGENGKELEAAEIWLKDPDRRKYHGIRFDPTRSGSSDRFYNLWKGFTEKPVQGKADKYWNHVREIICNGDKEAYRYVRKWLSKVFQHPNEVHTALVLCGSQGVGKDTFVKPLGKLLGPHYAPLSNMHQLIGHFNGHLKNAVLIHANESFWGGHKKEAGALKSMITESYCFIESKGKDPLKIQSFWHIIFSSNEDWPVALDFDDRRFIVLQVSDKHKGDQLYFQELNNELDNGGRAALLYDLLHEDLTDFNPRIMPSLSHAFNIKMRSAESPERYIWEALQVGSFSIGLIDTDGNERGDTIPVWQGDIPKQDVYQDYRTWCHDTDETPVTKQLFGRALKKVLPSIKEKRPAGASRTRCYKFQSLEKTKEEFCKSVKTDPKIVFDEVENNDDQSQQPDSVHTESDDDQPG